MASVLGFKRIYSTYYDIDSIADTIKDALDGNIFQLVHSFAFPCDNTFSFYTAVIQNKHISALQIPVNHAFLLLLYTLLAFLFYSKLRLGITILLFLS